MIAIRRLTARGVLALALGGGLGCARENRPPRLRDGTARMADTLAVLYAQALANPMGNRFLNRERAEALQAEIARQTGQGEAALALERPPVAFRKAGLRAGEHRHP